MCPFCLATAAWIAAAALSTGGAAALAVTKAVSAIANAKSPSTRSQEDHHG